MLCPPYLQFSPSAKKGKTHAASALTLVRAAATPHVDLRDLEVLMEHSNFWNILMFCYSYSLFFYGVMSFKYLSAMMPTTCCCMPLSGCSASQLMSFHCTALLVRFHVEIQYSSKPNAIHIKNGASNFQKQKLQAKNTKFLT